jgi:hypothetical protein
LQEQELKELEEKLLNDLKKEDEIEQLIEDIADEIAPRVILNKRAVFEFDYVVHIVQLYQAPVGAIPAMTVILEGSDGVRRKGSIDKIDTSITYAENVKIIIKSMLSQIAGILKAEDMA